MHTRMVHMCHGRYILSVYVSDFYITPIFITLLCERISVLLTGPEMQPARTAKIKKRTRCYIDK